MTILILNLSVGQAIRVARACDTLQLDSHEAVGLRALDEFLTRVVGPIRGRRRTSARYRLTAAAARKRRSRR